MHLQAGYVKALLQSRQLLSLQTSAASIAVVSSSSAASLLAASQDVNKVLDQLPQFEALLGVSASQRERWTVGFADFDEGLLELKEGEVSR